MDAAGPVEIKVNVTRLLQRGECFGIAVNISKLDCLRKLPCTVTGDFLAASIVRVNTGFYRQAAAFY